MLPRNKLAVIHIAKKQTGMDDDTYRELLAGFGVASSKDLNAGDFAALMKHFEMLGFQSTSPWKKPSDSKSRLTAKVKAIMADMDLSEKYVDGIVKNMNLKNRDGRPVRNFRWLNTRQLHKLVAALSYHQKRQQR